MNSLGCHGSELETANQAPNAAASPKPWTSQQRAVEALAPRSFDERMHPWAEDPKTAGAQDSGGQFNVGFGPHFLHHASTSQGSQSGDGAAGRGGRRGTIAWNY